MKSQDEIDFQEYYPMYCDAKAYEKIDVERAIAKYLEILKMYRPSGSLYYSRPAILLERLKRYDEALQVCEIALRNKEMAIFNKPTRRGMEQEFTKRKERLTEKIKKQSDNPERQSFKRRVEI